MSDKLQSITGITSFCRDKLHTFGMTSIVALGLFEENLPLCAVTLKTKGKKCTHISSQPALE